MMASKFNAPVKILAQRAQHEAQNGMTMTE